MRRIRKRERDGKMIKREEKRGGGRGERGRKGEKKEK